MIGLGLLSPPAAHEWWRLWTCQLIHWDARHALLNGAATIPPLVLLPRRHWRRLIVWSVVAAPMVSAAVLASGFRGEYRGASGIVVGIWVFTGLILLREGESRSGCVLLGFVTGKLLVEASGAWPAASASFETVSAAHYGGAIAAMLLSRAAR